MSANNNNKATASQKPDANRFTQKHQGVNYTCVRLKKRGETHVVSVKDTDNNNVKTIGFKPKFNGKFFDWDPWIDGAALAGSAIAPELAPFLHMGKTALKHWLKKEKKEKSHEHKKHHKEGKEQAAFSGHADQRRLEPFENAHAKRISKAQVVRTFDGVHLPSSQALSYYEQKKLFARPEYEHVTIADNLRSCVKQSRLVKVQNIENYAPMKKESRISEHSVPVLNGDMGTSMDMHPVTISKSESHAVMAGSELLTDLSIPVGGGLPGNNIMDTYINPMSWVGTKLQIEAKTWQQFRFRKLIVEYCPTIGSGTTGNFIAWFTQDPYEQMSDGLQQRRNAMVHPHAVNFQPFSYMACGLTEKPQDNTLYYVDADAGADDRLVYQGRFLITNNAQNSDVSTVPAYGTITLHYEIDFYFPRIDQTIAPPPLTNLSMTGDTAPAAYIPLRLTLLKSVNATTLRASPGNIYTFTFVTLPTNAATACNFVLPGSIIKPIVIGQTYLLRCSAENASDLYFYVFDSMKFANGGNTDTSGTIFYNNGTLPGASATWQLANPQIVNPFVLEQIKEEYPTPESSEDERDVIDLTHSERDIIDIKRRTSDLPLAQLPTMPSAHALTPKPLRR